MSTSTDRAREKLQVLLDIGSDQEFGAYCDLLDLAIKQHEALRGEHLYVVNQSPPHFDAVQRRDYTVADTCFECAVLLQWEQMWGEKQ